MFALVLTSRHPALTIHVLVLATQVHPLNLLPVLPSLAQRSCTRGELALHCRVLLDPIRERILAILDNRLARLVAVISVPRFTGRDRCVVDEFQEVFAEAGNDGELLAVLAQGIELVGESCLELLARDVRELRLGDERFGFGTNELLFEDDDLRAVRFLVFELGNLVGDLLFA